MPADDPDSEPAPRSSSGRGTHPPDPIPQAGPDETNEDAARDRAVRTVERELEELGDPEASPGLPSTTLAARSATTSSHAAADAQSNLAPRGELIRLAWPVMLTLALATIGNMVDRAMIGWLDGGVGAAAALAGAAYATQFFFLIQSALFAIGLAAADGSRHDRHARMALAAAMQVALGVTGLLTATFFLFARRGFEMLGAEPHVIETSLPYLYCLLSSTVLLAYCLVVDSALRANRNTLTPMRVAAGITVVKLAGNAILIYGLFGAPALGLTGAGLASLISQVCGVVLFAVALRREPQSSPVRFSRESWRGAGALRPEVVRIGLPGVIERLIMSGAQLAFFGVLSHYYGTVAIAAYAVGVPLLSFTWIPGQGYAQATATLVGHALGADDPRRAVRTGWNAAGLALITAIAVGVPVALGRESFAQWFTGDAAVVAELGPFLLVLALTQPFLQLHFTLGGAHRGAGDTMTPLFAATASNFLRLALAWLAAEVLSLPVVWVWAAILLDHVFRAAFLLVTFRSERWLRPRKP